MTTNIAGGVCIGQGGACIVRIAKLDADCTPTGGVNGGIVTAGLVTMTATPEIEDGTVYEPKTACGSVAYTYERQSRLKRWDITGEFVFFDFEMMTMMCGGSLILGNAPFAGKVIGWAAPLADIAQLNGVYLEIITQNFTPDQGDCQNAVPGAYGAGPMYEGHIFPKAKFWPGARTFADEAATFAVTGKAGPNGFIYNGPWNDFPGAGYAPNSSYYQVGYTAAQYNAILATVTCGYVDIPAGS